MQQFAQTIDLLRPLHEVILALKTYKVVIPAQAGIQASNMSTRVIIVLFFVLKMLVKELKINPACVRLIKRAQIDPRLDSSLRWNDEVSGFC